MNKKRKGFTVTELLVIVAILAIIGAMIYGAISTFTSKQSISVEIPTSNEMKTVLHDGHIWIVCQPSTFRDGIHVIHHPDCTCNKRVLAEKE